MNSVQGALNTDDSYKQVYFKRKAIRKKLRDF